MYLFWRKLLGIHCQSCHTLLYLLHEQNYSLCLSCQQDLFRIREPVCKSCGIPLISENTVCIRCRNSECSTISSRACFFYYGNIVEIMHHYKNSGDWGLMTFFADQLFLCYSRYFAPLPLVPLVSNPLSRKRRGFDPVCRIARYLQKKYAITVHYYLRRLPGKSQKTLSAVERATNLRGKFQLLSHEKMPPEVVLLDDVRTTGSTAREGARILMTNGIHTCHLMSITLPFPT